MGTEAVAEQCRAIEEWRRQVGQPKRHDTAQSTESLEARIEAFCKLELEQAYRQPVGEHP